MTDDRTPLNKLIGSAMESFTAQINNLNVEVSKVHPRSITSGDQQLLYALAALTTKAQELSKLAQDPQ